MAQPLQKIKPRRGRKGRGKGYLIKALAGYFKKDYYLFTDKI
jgi:hypothetical protein